MRTQSASFVRGTDSDVTTFRPFPGLGNPHAQTIAARVRRSRLTPRYVRHRLDTDDGDFLDLDVRELETGDAESPVATCLLLHGLEGCAGSGYMIGTAEALAGRGILPIALNFRSCSGEPNRTLGSYHSGRTDDLRRALDWIERRWPALPRTAAGFSLGGNALIVHMGETGERTGLDAAVATSVPYSLADCAAGLERGLCRLYGRYFMNSLKRKAREKARRFPGEVPAAALAARTVREFDDAFTAPINGFDDADDYYRRCSAAGFVDSVRVPTLLLQAADDPMVPASSLPRELIAANPALELHLTDRGGHVGYYGAADRGVEPGWMERRIASFLSERVGTPRDRFAG